MSDLIKKDGESPGGVTLRSGKLVAKQTGFRQRVADARAAQLTPDSAVHRICLMLDRSSSMSGWGSEKAPIDLLKEAVENFVMRCNPADTSIAIESFPRGASLPLTNVYLMVSQTAQALEANGGTPMYECIGDSSRIPMTRGVLVSDGDANSWRDDVVLDHYREAKIPIDCVHIGASTSGEARLRHIAELTGGLYIKFTDVSAFSTAFAYLTPGYRAMLTEGKVSASALGAKEIER